MQKRWWHFSPQLLVLGMSDDSSSSSTGTPEKFRIEIVQKSFSASSELQEEDVELGHFIDAYIELNKFIGLLGKIFHFVQVDVREKTAKLRELYQKAPTYQSVKKMIAFEHENKDYTGSKALLALHRALEFICAFINALAESTNEDSVSLICRKTYEDTLARFHPWVIRKAVGLASYTLPSRGQLITSIQGSMPEESYCILTLPSKSQFSVHSITASYIQALSYIE
ncbi:unnamed protein product [Cylicocyclus nassatus]|uniref:Glycolipid transfer protein domain-containing protein n=1 Tax=Cylicocyclus nassatus TaxID=53992 RepID=A0AA36LZC6_CYLNA|nr:unnamed protein product [Cylicocyclus nassatus]